MPDTYARDTYERFAEQVQKAKDYITRELGFDAWSIELADNHQAAGFLVPEDIFKKYGLRDELTKYIEDVFQEHYIDVRLAEWRKDSQRTLEERENSEYYGDYCVNWCGSRHCQVELKHHLLLVFAPGNWAPRSHRIVRDDYCHVPRLPYKWYKQEDREEMPYGLREWAVTD